MHVSPTEYQRPHDLTPPASEIIPVEHYSSHVSWESETSYLPLQEAIFENCEFIALNLYIQKPCFIGFSEP